MKHKQPWQERLSTWGHRFGGGFFVFVGFITTVGLPQRSSSGEAPDLRWAGFFFLVGGLAFIGWTFPRFRQSVLTWRESLSYRWAELLAVYAVVLLLTFGFIQSFFGSIMKQQADSASDFASHAVEVRGRVVGFARGGEQAPVIFQFQVGTRVVVTSDNTRYTASPKDAEHATTPRWTRPKIGAQVPVVYDRRDSQNAIIGDTATLREQARSARMMQMIVAPLFTAFVFLSLLFRGVLPLPRRRSEPL